MSTVNLLPTDVLPSAVLAVRPWADDVIDLLGHDPRSAYVELFWLGVLGPSTTWILRRLASQLEASPEGFDLDLNATASALGLSVRPGRAGRGSPFIRALARLCTFDLAQTWPDGSLAVRRKVPPLSVRQVQRLTPDLSLAHRQYQESELRTPVEEQLLRRARRLALSLFELGEDFDATEHQLARWRFSPATSRDAATWARDRHHEAQQAQESSGSGCVA